MRVLHTDTEGDKLEVPLEAREAAGIILSPAASAVGETSPVVEGVDDEDKTRLALRAVEGVLVTERVREPHFVMLGDVEWERVRVLQMDTVGDKLDVPLTLGLGEAGREAAGIIVSPAPSADGETTTVLEGVEDEDKARLALRTFESVLVIEIVREPHFVMLGDAD